MLNQTIALWRIASCVAVLAVGACTDNPPPIKGTQSLQVDIVTPTTLGDIDNRLPATTRTVTFNVTALNEKGATDVNFNNTIQVYVHYLGTLTPYLGMTPLLTVPMSGGKATNVTLMLPPVFGPTTIWVDDGTDTSATYATGVSATLWYRDPFVVDIQTPLSEASLDAFSAAPLDTKNVDVRLSRYGANGRLVVTSVFSQGYTLADVNCADANGTPPCVSADYDYLEVFSYSAPLDQDKRFISEGEVIDGFAGGVTEFDGLTEIGFPQTFVSGDPVIDKAKEPPVVKLDPLTWFTTMKIQFERNEAGAIEIDNGKVCPLDADYITYKQWKLDPSGSGDATTCSGSNVINVISTGLQFDPSTVVGKVVPKVVGMIRPINIGSFNVWILYPRSLSDLTLP